MADTLSIALVNDRAEIDRLSQLIEQFAEANSLSPEVAFHVNLALDELITNLIKHGYDDHDRHDISVRLALTSPDLVVELEDDGRAFNPLDVQPPNLQLGLDDRPIGGLGIHFVRSVMTSVEYRRAGGHNILTLRKRTG
jgi:anti-sigma regulatory factor (Ser/Thr protein kinase)